MEKRTLIAVALSFAILLLWQVLILGPQEKARLAQMAAQDSLARANAARTAAEGAGSGAEIGPPGGVGSVAPGDAASAPAGYAGTAAASGLAPVESGAPEQTVTVATDLVRMTLSTRGARVSSLSLLGFPSYRGGVVDLVPGEGPGAFGLTLHLLEGETKRDLPLDEYVFAVDAVERTLGPGEEGAVTFTGEPLPGLRVTKRIVARGGTYDWTMDVAIDRAAGAPAVFSYTVDLGAGLALTEENQKEDFGFMSGAIREEEKLLRKNLARMKPGQALGWSGKIRWAALTNKYFVIGAAAQGNPPLEVAMSPTAGGNGLGMALTLPHAEAGAAGRGAIAIYAGPQDARLVEASPLRMAEVIDYGWRPFQPISQFLLWCLNQIYRLIPNFGVAIILISTATKVAFFRLSHQSYKSMRDMQKIQGELQSLRDRYQNDPKKLNTETMALYKKHGVNPLGGCLPLLLQTPVFIALYNVLRRTIELRQAPFALWIGDLAAPDVLVRLPFALPFLGAAVSLLPILLGLATFFQQKMTTVDPKQKMLLYIMPVFMTVIFYHFPAGLNLYWLANTTLTVAQQSLIERKERAREAEAAAGGGAAQIVELPAREARARGGKSRRRAHD
jgi:YidC/Oxa1 family membrane protein insertase